MFTIIIVNIGGIVMKKFLYIGIFTLAMGCLSLMLDSLETQNVQAADVTLSTSVQEYLSFSITSGATVAFGALTPGTPIAAPATGTVASVTTNASNGYQISLSDGSDTDSPLVHTDTSTKISDFSTASTLASPVAWGTSTGLGVTLYAADTSKEAGWGDGTTYGDTNNKYAKIPASAAVGHTVSTYKATADTSTWAFKIDVPNTQKTGSYTGAVTFTATAVLS